MGHLFRSIELARALADHQIILIAGGREVDIALPKHVTPFRLPGLYMDEQFTTLIAEDTGKKVEAVQRERKRSLFSLFEQQQPDVFMTELYPFGRSFFGFELQPLLDQICQGRFGEIKVVCSLRDILVEKKDPHAYEARVLNLLNTYFDLLLIHSDDQLLSLDETFSRMDDIRIPTVYTGFVGPKANPAAGRRLRKELGIGADEKLIVTSTGGGRSGYALLSGVMDAYHLLANPGQIRMEVFAGPFRDPEEFKKLTAKAANGIRLRHFTKRFVDYLSAADLSISLAGYNTCMNLMATRVPAIVYPYSKQQEQPLRVAKISKLIPMQVLGDDDIEPARLSHYIQKMLRESRPAESRLINLDGAQNTADYLNTWMGSYQGNTRGK